MVLPRSRRPHARLARHGTPWIASTVLGAHVRRPAPCDPATPPPALSLTPCRGAPRPCRSSTTASPSSWRPRACRSRRWRWPPTRVGVQLRQPSSHPPRGGRQPRLAGPRPMNKPRHARSWSARAPTAPPSPSPAPLTSPPCASPTLVWRLPAGALLPASHAPRPRSPLPHPQTTGLSWRSALACWTWRWSWRGSRVRPRQDDAPPGVRAAARLPCCRTWARACVDLQTPVPFRA